jgi:hypothetical protein
MLYLKASIGDRWMGGVYVVCVVLGGEFVCGEEVSVDTQMIVGWGCGGLLSPFGETIAHIGESEG